MSRDEYKIKIKTFLFFNNITLPSWAKWIAIDYDSELSVHSSEPHYDSMREYKSGNYGLWQSTLPPENKIGDKKTMMEFFGYVDFEFGDSGDSLISIEELFND